MKKQHSIDIIINNVQITFESHEQTGQSIKEQALIPLDHILTMEHGQHGNHSDCNNQSPLTDNDFTSIANNHEVKLKNGQYFWSHEVKKNIEVTINRVKYSFDSASQTGRDLKERAGIDPADVLFRSKPSEDEVVPNDVEIKLHCGDCFYSSPPANYGSIDLTPIEVGSDQFECISQPDGWMFLLISNFPLSVGYSLDSIQLLIKLPPGFPDASPDMFWVSPHVKTKSGVVPQGTSAELLLGQQWQRFSWHLQPGAWRPGISTLRDFMRCVHSRFERLN